MELFWTFAGVPVWLKCLFVCAKNLDEYYTKFIPSKFFSLFLVSFFIVLFKTKQGFKIKEVFIKIQITSITVFWCFVAMKIVVSVW